MAFQIIDIGGFNVAIGMEWPYSNGEPEEKAAELDAKGYIALSNDVNEIVGIALELPKKDRLYALAAICLSYLSDHSRHAAFVIEVQQRRIAFIGILDGLPVSSYDRLLNVDNVHDTLDKFIQDAGVTGVVVYTNLEEIAKDYREIAQLITIEDLCGPLADKKVAESLRIRKIAGSPWLWLVWIFILVCAAGYMGWKWYQEQTIMAQAARQAAENKSPQQHYDESLPSAYAKAGWDLKEAVRVIDAISNRQLSRGGWETEKIVCSQLFGGCEITWKKQEVAATFATFSSDTPEPERKALFYKQDNIIEGVAISTKPMGGWNTAALGTKASVFNNQLSKLQRLAATGDAQVVYRDPTPYATNGQAIARPVFQGGITFSGNAYLLPMLSRIDGSFFSVSEIAFSFTGGQPAFKIEFNYYTGEP